MNFEAAQRLRRARILAVVVVASIVVVVDQITKTLAIDHLSSGPVHLVGPLSLVLGFNTGIAFSLGARSGLPLIIVVVGVVAVLLYCARIVPSYPAAVALGLVVGGSIGNLGDRLFRGRSGAVVDFIHTGFWPTFNIADASIVCGCFGLAIVFWKRSGTNTHASNELAGHDQQLNR